MAWARTSIHVQEYGTRRQHDFHLTPYFLEFVLEQSLQTHRFSNSAITRRPRGLPIVGFLNCGPTCKANSNSRPQMDLCGFARVGDRSHPARALGLTGRHCRECVTFVATVRSH